MHGSRACWRVTVSLFRALHAQARSSNRVAKSLPRAVPVKATETQQPEAVPMANIGLSAELRDAVAASGIRNATEVQVRLWRSVLHAAARVRLHSQCARARAGGSARAAAHRARSLTARCASPSRSSYVRSMGVYSALRPANVSRPIFSPLCTVAAAEWQNRRMVGGKNALGRTTSSTSDT